MTRTSSLEVSIKTHIDCTLNISSIISTVLCMYITAPPVNHSILCLSSTVHIVAFVNLLLKKMVVIVVVGYVNSLKSLFIFHSCCSNTF